MSALLDRARAASPRKQLVALAARLDLAIAFARGEVDATQARVALGYKSQSNIHNALGATIISGVRRGLIRIVKELPHDPHD